jgi:hypothetical protein
MMIAGFRSVNYKIPVVEPKHSEVNGRDRRVPNKSQQAEEPVEPA